MVYTINWRFNYEEEVDLEINAVSRSISSADVYPEYFKTKIPDERYFVIQLYEGDDEYMNAVNCNGLETNRGVESLDIVVHDSDGHRRYLCYVRFIENNVFRVNPGRNPHH